MLRSAANPGSQQVDVVVSQLPIIQQQSVAETVRGVSSAFNSAAARGRQGLLDIDDDEWDRLVESANE